MQRIIKDRQVVDDRWHLLPKDATLESVPNSDDVIIPLACGSSTARPCAAATAAWGSGWTRTRSRKASPATSTGSK